MKQFWILSLLLFLSLISEAQQKIKVKKEDNRFLLFKLGEQNDVIIKGKADLFLIKLPDSLKKDLVVMVENGRFSKTTNDTIYKILPIKGMKYSHTFVDTTFEVLLEGVCNPSSTIFLEVKNRKTKKVLLQNKFLAK